MRLGTAGVILLVMVSGVPTLGTADEGAARPAVTGPADPDADVIGWEDGYWHNESVAVDQSDGLSDAEIEAFVARSMARVEYLREQEYTSRVPVDVVSREEYQTNSSGPPAGESFSAWNNQVWEALFLVGEETDVQDKLGAAYGSSVAGFYSPGNDHIRIVTDSPERPVIDNATLVHELVHALQDQTRGFNGTAEPRNTQDGELAADSVVEGEANYIETRYTQRCGVEWECVRTPRRAGGGGEPPHLGILLTLLHPYSDGPVYVDWLRDGGGWPAVEERFSNPPVSTEQVIHLTDERPTPLAYEDYARNGWERFPEQGEDGSDTAGEASMYVMFWYQARVSGADTVPVQSVARTSSPYDIYNYDATPSAGWANDRIFPYRNETATGTEYGYVWVSEWDTERDARQFENAYRAILSANGATARGNGVHVVESGEFADAFRVVRTGTRVTVVNGPTAGALRDIRPRNATDGEHVSAVADPVDADSPTGLSAPGFRIVAAVLAIALLAAVAVLRRR